MNKKLFLFLGILVISTEVHSSDSGLDLYQTCIIVEEYLSGKESAISNTDNAINFGYCLGMLEAVRDMNSFLVAQGDGTHFFCAPNTGIANEEALRIFIQHVKNNPANAKLAQTGTILHAFKTAFPCNE